MNVFNRSLRAGALLSALALGGGASAASAAPTDYNGTWFVTEYDEIQRPDEGDVPYTEAAAKTIAHYKAYFDPVTESAVNFCNTIGMPWTMLARARDYPREVYQTEDRILMFFEYMDQYRIIYLDRSSVPENWAGSKQGYSIGRWDGDELVVETTGFSASSEYSIFQRSDEARMIERWRRYEDAAYGDVIEVSMEITDPLVYSEPRKGRTLWKRAEPGTVINSYACPETIWEEYAVEHMERLESSKATD